MGGLDKPLLEWKGRPLIAQVIERLIPQCATLLISANRSQPKYATFGFPVIQDRSPDVGPLGGLEAAQDAITTPLVFVCAGDMPCLDRQIVSRLTGAMSPTTEAVLAHDGERIQPLVMLVRVSALATIADFLAAGGRAVHAWVATCRTVNVDTSDIAASFYNVNTPDDLREERLEAGGGHR